MYNKRGQLTYFIIIAIIIVAAILIIMFVPSVRNIFIASTPELNFRSCVDGPLNDAIEMIGKRGGSVVPAHYVNYGGERVEYLCYTNQFYQTCVNQQPMLKTHVEREINDVVNPQLKACANSFKEELRGEGYSISGGDVDVDVELILNNIRVNINSDITIRKDGLSTRFESYSYNEKSSLYNMIMIANSIINWEAQYGDSETTLYMLYYPNMRVRKLTQGDGTKVYSLEDVNTNEKFIFASRSLSFPPGYGFGKYVKG